MFFLLFVAHAQVPPAVLMEALKDGASSRCYSLMRNPYQDNLHPGLTMEEAVTEVMALRDRAERTGNPLMGICEGYVLARYPDSDMVTHPVKNTESEPASTWVEPTATSPHAPPPLPYKDSDRRIALGILFLLATAGMGLALMLFRSIKPNPIE